MSKKLTKKEAYKKFLKPKTYKKMKINSKNMEMAKKNFNKYSGADKVITKIKLAKKKGRKEHGQRMLHNEYDITYKPRERKG